jgi:hypothetical protein
MRLYIESLNTNLPLGKLVYEYGEQQYYKGVLTGFIVGSLTTLLIMHLRKA